MTDKQSTRKTLLIKAGELFAEHGFDRVTTRLIAEAAGVRLSAIHYHFTNKENLYLEAFRYARDRDNRVDFCKVLAENPSLGKTPAGQAEIIRTTVLRYYHNIFQTNTPSWQTELLVREMVSPSSALPILAKRFFKPEMDNSERFCRMIRPEMDRDEAAIWAYTLFSHLFLYIMARKPIEIIRGQAWLTPGFFHKVARMTARFMILELGLPLPEDLQNDHRQFGVDDHGLPPAAATPIDS
jgi:AcrR family transcriptional regulator